MKPEEIKLLLEHAMPQATIVVNGVGCDLAVTVIAEFFVNMTLVKRQQHVYSFLSSSIVSGDLHAISLRTFTPEEWTNKQIENAK